MGTKMKGLLKGLRYISQIFDEDGKEQEMEIGFPTDVKHVAHIGWDGPSVSGPSWMNEFPSPSAPNGENGAGNQPKFPSSEFGGAQDSTSAARDLPDVPARRPSRRNASSGGASVDSPHNEPRHSRRHQSSSAAVDSSVRESLEGSRHSRRHRSSAGLRHESTAGSGGGSESQEGGVAAAKRDRPSRKTKGSTSGGGSVRSTSRPKAVASESEGMVESQLADAAPSLKTMGAEEGLRSPAEERE